MYETKLKLRDIVLEQKRDKMKIKKQNHGWPKH